MARLILVERGEDVIVGGDNVSVVGTSSAGEIITVVSGFVTFDASFNRGGDAILLPGSASDFTVRTEGAVAIFESETATVRIPAGNVGISIGFDDGIDARTLVIDTSGVSPIFLIGSTVIGKSPTQLPMTDSSSGFTAAIDSLIGSDADDLFLAITDFIDAGDRLTDPSSSDNDRLVVVADGASDGAIFGNTQISGIETLEIRQFELGPVDLELSGFSGLQTINLFSQGGTIALHDIGIDSENFSPAAISFDGTGSSALWVEINGDPDQFPHPSEVTASLSLKSAEVYLISYRLFFGTEKFRSLDITLENDVSVDYLQVAANALVVRGDYSFTVNNPISQVTFFDFLGSGPVSMKLGDESNIVNVESLTDDWKIDAAGGDDDRLTISSSTSLSASHGLSGFEDISIEGEDQSYSFVFNSHHAPSLGRVLEFYSGFAGEDVTDGFALVIETDTDGQQRSYSMEIAGSNGANYIDVSRGGQQDTVWTGSADDVIFLGSPNSGPGDTLFAGDGNDLITVVGFGDTEIHTGPGEDFIDALKLNPSSALSVYGNIGNQTLHVTAFGPEDVFHGDGENDIDTLIVDYGNPVLDQSFTNVSGVEVLRAIDEMVTDEAGSRYVELGELAERAGLQKVELGDGGYLVRAPSFSSQLELVGGAGDDVFLSGFGRDTISGGAGNDEIIGGGGADTISGGTGQDFFGYRLGDSSIVSFDTILDFSFDDGDKLVFEVFVDNNNDGVYDDVVFSGDYNTLEQAEAALSADDGRVEVVYVSAISTHGGGFVYVDMNDDGEIDENDIGVLLKGIGNFQAGDFLTYTGLISQIETSWNEALDPGPAPIEEIHFKVLDELVIM